ncbi:hypothetical protein B0H14DRAFT_2667834 [Mycena olivaceomarginata]|nr:hypothetical protein B0H14DRAFT_2667834 [Mycena olivaceomarginata]
MFKRITKWPRKRPREPGKPGSSTGAPDSEASGLRKMVSGGSLIPQAQDPSGNGTQSAPTNRRNHRSTLALEVASLAAKTLVIASDAPVVSVFKPLAGLADLACQRFQTVHSYKEAIERLEKQAIPIGTLITRIAEGEVSFSIRPRIDDILQVLEEVDRLLDKTSTITKPIGSKRQKLKLWITATRELAEVNALSDRLRDAVYILCAELNLRSISHGKSAQERDREVLSSELANFAQKIYTPYQLAFLIFRAGVSWGAPRQGVVLGGVRTLLRGPVKIAE